MMNKLGMHIHGLRPGIAQAVELLQPRTVTIMDPKSEDIQAIRDVSPWTFIAMRKYEDGRPWQETDPFEWAEQCYNMCDGLADGVIAWNEPFGHDDRSSCRPFDEWTYSFLTACRRLGAMEAVVLCMATGNWTGADDRYKITDDFPLACTHATYFGPHEYSWPNLQAGMGWHALRFKAWIEDLKTIGRDNFWFVISEAGLTQAVIAGRDDVGWRSGGPEGVTEDSYIATLDWYNAELCKVPEVLGCCLFDYAGSHYGWETFEQLGLEGRIFQIQAPEMPEPPEPPEEVGMIRVFNLEGIELFGEEAFDLIAYHGITVHEPRDMRPDEWYWAVVKMEVREGPACFIFTGLKEDGSVAAGQEAAWAWSDDMGDADDIQGNSHPTDWQDEADLGLLNENGNMGPAFGQSGWWHEPYEPGPGRAWIRDPLRWAVRLTGIGMEGGTNHRTMYATWQLKQWQSDGETPIPPADGVVDEILALAIETNQTVKEIKAILEDYVPPEPPEADEVFHVEFFNNVDLEGPPVYTMIERKPFVHDWGEGSPVPGVVNEDYISGRWRGNFTFDETRIYMFSIRTDDGVRLWVDGKLALDRWFDQPRRLYGVKVQVTAGRREVRLEWFERAGAAYLEFDWA